MIQSLFTKRPEGSPSALESGSDEPFHIDCSPAVSDAVRLAIASALARGSGGWRIVGGVFFGWRDGNRVVLTETAAFPAADDGKPGAALRSGDNIGLQALLASSAQRGDGAKPVGWYRSVRGELSFTETDLGMHRRYFPEPWQPLLLLKPDGEKPTRAAFFFPNMPGALRAGRSHEFLLEQTSTAADAALPAKLPATEHPPEPKPDPVAPILPSIPPAPQRSDHARTDAEAKPPMAERLDSDTDGAAAAMRPPDEDVASANPANRRRSAWVALGVVAALCGATGVGYQFGRLRPKSAPAPTAVSRPMAPPAATLRLVTIEEDGQLQILWDPSASVILSSRGGALTLTDLDETRRFSLDRTQLETGSFTYRRQGERVDVVLTLSQPDGHDYVQATVYFARTKPAPDSGGTDNRQTARLKSDLVNQTRRADRLEQLLGRARRDLEKQRQARAGQKR